MKRLKYNSREEVGRAVSIYWVFVVLLQTVVVEGDSDKEGDSDTSAAREFVGINAGAETTESVEDVAKVAIGRLEKESASERKD
jgi:hypothetical protein